MSIKEAKIASAMGTLAPAIVLLGAPGSGKGTQAKLMRQFLKCPHVSTGDMLRAHIYAGDAIGTELQESIAAGKLAPDNLVNRIVEKRLAEPDCRVGVILDAYPRTLGQAGVFLSITERYGFRPAMIHLMADYEKIVARLKSRRQCPVCGTVYSLATNPPKVSGICVLDGAALVAREDDRESVVRERLDAFEQQTRPLLEYFRNAGVTVLDIQATGGSPEEIAARICEGLEDDGIIPVAIRAPKVSIGT